MQLFSILPEYTTINMKSFVILQWLTSNIMSSSHITLQASTVLHADSYAEVVVRINPIHLQAVLLWSWYTTVGNKTRVLRTTDVDMKIGNVITAPLALIRKLKNQVNKEACRKSSQHFVHAKSPTISKTLLHFIPDLQMSAHINKSTISTRKWQHSYFFAQFMGIKSERNVRFTRELVSAIMQDPTFIFYHYFHWHVPKTTLSTLCLATLLHHSQRYTATVKTAADQKYV